MQTWLEVSDWLLTLEQKLRGPCPFPGIGKAEAIRLEKASRALIDHQVCRVIRGSSPPLSQEEVFWVCTRLGQVSKLVILFHCSPNQHPGPDWKTDVQGWLVEGWKFGLAEQWAERLAP